MLQDIERQHEQEIKDFQEKKREAEFYFALFKEQKKFHEDILFKRTDNLADSHQLGIKYLFTLNGAAAIAMVTIITSYKEKLDNLTIVFAITAFIMGCIFSLIAIYYLIRWQEREQDKQVSKLRMVNAQLFMERLKIVYYKNLIEPDTSLERKTIFDNSDRQSRLDRKIKIKIKRLILFLLFSFVAFIVGISFAVYPFLPSVALKSESQITICNSSYPECSRILAAPSVTKPN